MIDKTSSEKLEDNGATSKNVSLDGLYDQLFGWKGFICSLFGIAVGVAIEHEFPLGVVAGEIIKEVGIAGFVLVGIGLTLDRRHRRTFEKEVMNLITQFRENSFQAMFNWLVPADVLLEIERQMLTGGIIRESCEIEYVLKRLPDSLKSGLDESYDLENRMLVETRMKCDIRNMKPDPQRHILKLAVEKEDASSFNAVYSVWFTPEFGETVHLNEEDLKELRRDNPEDVNHTYAVDLGKILPNQVVKVEVLYRNLAPIDRNREVFTHSVVTRHVSVRVQSEIEGLEVLCEGLCPHDVKSMPVGSYVHGYMERQWRNEHPMLPGQGIMLWWRLIKVRLPKEATPESGRREGLSKIAPEIIQKAAAAAQDKN